MAILDGQGRLFGKINLVDGVISLAIILGVLGVLLVQSGWHVTSGQVVQGESDILISVQIPRLTTLDKNLFKPGAKTAITIRNQPRGDVLVESVKSTPSRVPFLDGAGKPVAVPDVSQTNSYDYILKLKDHAKVTADGYVAEGVKVKIGLPIELEGFKYRVYGKIVNVEAVQ